MPIYSTQETNNRAKKGSQVWFGESVSLLKSLAVSWSPCPACRQLLQRASSPPAIAGCLWNAGKGPSGPFKFLIVFYNFPGSHLNPPPSPLFPTEENNASEEILILILMLCSRVITVQLEQKGQATPSLKTFPVAFVLRNRQSETGGQ